MRSFALASLVVLAPCFAAGEVRAEERPKPTVTLSCERGTEAGRVRCSVEAKSAEAIRWGDVEILSVPDFAQALKGRIGPRDATSHDESFWRWGFAVVARKSGTGEVVVRVRLVSCVAKDRCTTHAIESRAQLQVG